jgi:spermidine synthase
LFKPEFLMAILFGSTLFVSALLLFMIQPLVGRLVLPLLGGSATVWTTCLVFFQAVLLAGYAWSHAMTRMPARAQSWVHLGVLLMAVLTLPLRLLGDLIPSATSSPQARLLAVLVSSVGLVFFALATNAPTLQRWFAATGHPRRKDPYFLYSASNAGSLLGLMLYPIVLEPYFTVTQHRWAWTAGYVVLLVLMGACALVRWSTPPASAESTAPSTPRPTWPTIGRWVWLAVVPSSLTIGCTAYLSAELAPVPLLWVVPLAIYLVTFIISFTGHVIRPTNDIVGVSAMMGLLLATMHIAGSATNATGVALHLGALFLICALCHGRLADSRPAPDHLTAFYLWISVGGVAGGLSNALVAPALFNTAIEYPLMLLAAPLAFRTGARSEAPRARLDTCVSVLPFVGALVWLSITAIPHASVALLLPLGAIAYELFRQRGVRLIACGVLTVMFLQLANMARREEVMVRRSFYSVLRVAENYEPGYRGLIHGATVHGMQSYDPVMARRAVTYFAAEGPIGQVFSAFAPRLERARIGVVGLGVGELAVYARPGQDWTFFEIDALVERVATRQFTYLRDAAVTPRVVIGDGRRSLAAVGPGTLDVLVLDAFSSDAIPVHLLTREAIELYRSRLRPDGILAIHISNRFVDLAPLLAGAARASGSCGRQQFDAAAATSSGVAKRRVSHWVVLAAPCAALEPLDRNGRWRPLVADDASPVWTDDRADLMTVVRWSHFFAMSTR